LEYEQSDGEPGAKPKSSRHRQGPRIRFHDDTPNGLRLQSGHGRLLHGMATEQQTADLVNLLELFQTVDRQLVEDIFTGCGHSFDAALESLQEIAGSIPGLDTSVGSAGLANPPHACMEPEGACSWNVLPEDVKDIILGLLPSRDLARAASTCKEFARRVNTGRLNAKTLTIPSGLSLHGIISMVAGHPNARSVSLARWGPEKMRSEDFDALLTAISHGSRSSRRNVPVECISFRGWGHLTDGNIMALCHTMQHLREVDLTDCRGITDAALTALAKYQRMAPADDEEDEHTAASEQLADDEEELQFPGDSAAADLDPDAAAAAALQEPPADSTADDDDDEEEEDMDEETRRAVLESLAHMASSPPATALTLSSSPPSSLMAVDVALGARMTGLHVRGAASQQRTGLQTKQPGAGSYSRTTTSSYSSAPSVSMAARMPGSGQMEGVRGAREPLGLNSVVLAGCSSISADAVRALMSAPLLKASLSHLDVSRCMRITRAALCIPPSSNLRVLKCAGCNNLHEVIIQLPPTCPLTELHLNNCKQLTKLLLVAPNLKLLHLGGCKALGTLTMRCPHLTQLLANLCFSLADVAAEQWQCARLQHLNLFGARHLATASLAAILQQSPRLRHLNLNGCTTLTGLAVEATHEELHSLDISGCKNMRRASVLSPHLRELLAKACPRLEDLVLASPQLQQLDVSHCQVLRTLQMPALQQQQQEGGQGAGAAAAVVALLPAVRTSGSERLPHETLRQLQQIRAAREGARAAAAAAADI